MKLCMSWKANISYIKDLPADEYVSYGRTYRSETPVRAATITCGYADGYHRAAGKNGYGSSEDEEGVCRWHDLVLDDRRHRVLYAGHEITLTNREFLMLKTLLENQDIVLSRETLLNKVCGYDYVGETNVVDVYIRYLRSKIDDAFGVKMIRTVRGVGYVIKSETE